MGLQELNVMHMRLLADVVDRDRLPGQEGAARRRRRVADEPDMANDAVLPTASGAYQEIVVVGW